MNIFKYDKQDNLTEFVEYQDQKLKSAYHFNGTVLRKVRHDVEVDDEFYQEVKTVTTYPSGGVMHHHYFDGESKVVVRTPNGDYLPPIKQLEINDGTFTRYSVKPELLQRWKK